MSTGVDIILNFVPKAEAALKQLEKLMASFKAQEKLTNAWKKTTDSAIKSAVSGFQLLERTATAVSHNISRAMGGVKSAISGIGGAVEGLAHGIEKIFSLPAMLGGFVLFEGTKKLLEMGSKQGRVKRLFKGTFGKNAGWMEELVKKYAGKAGVGESELMEAAMPIFQAAENTYLPGGRIATRTGSRVLTKRQAGAEQKTASERALEFLARAKAIRPDVDLNEAALAISESGSNTDVVRRLASVFHLNKAFLIRMEAAQKSRNFTGIMNKDEISEFHYKKGQQLLTGEFLSLLMQHSGMTSSLAKGERGTEAFKYEQIKADIVERLEKLGEELLPVVAQALPTFANAVEAAAPAFVKAAEIFEKTATFLAEAWGSDVKKRREVKGKTEAEEETDTRDKVVDKIMNVLSYVSPFPIPYSPRGTPVAPISRGSGGGSTHNHITINASVSKTTQDAAQEMMQYISQELWNRGGSVSR